MFELVYLEPVFFCSINLYQAFNVSYFVMHSFAFRVIQGYFELTLIYQGII